MSIRRRIFLVLCFAVFSASIAAQDSGSSDNIKVDTRLVSVPVVVSDRDGRYVPNLDQHNFSVFEDGKKQKIDFFAAVEEPLTIAVLIDTSQSTRPVLGDIKKSAESFVKLLNPRDRAMIVCFDYDTHVLSPLTNDQKQLKDAVKRADIPRGVGTVLRDAAFETVNQTLSPIKGRKAVIILTDGKDAGSRVSTDELLYSLQETDTLVYTIMFKTDPRMARAGMGGRGGGFPGGSGGGFPGGRGGYPGRPANPQRSARIERQNDLAEVFLQKLAEVTAGRFYSSKDGKVKDTFDSIVQELRYQYRLGFYPPEEDTSGAVHEIKVKVDRDGSVVRARPTFRSR